MTVGKSINFIVEHLNLSSFSSRFFSVYSLEIEWILPPFIETINLHLKFIYWIKLKCSHIYLFTFLIALKRKSCENSVVATKASWSTYIVFMPILHTLYAIANDACEWRARNCFRTARNKHFNCSFVVVIFQDRFIASLKF